MFKRKCRVLCVALLAMCSGSLTWGLGLGEIDVQSALNEKFEGSIELLEARGLQASEVVVNMASTEHFERIGVERFYYLTTLSFEVDLDGPGGPRVLVSSSQPISEPYLDFIVEVRWPNGRLYKEFT
ncbi:MAG: peptigoglycan-binding protein LysM, partial [Pseudomonadota bacterium]